MTFSFRFVSFFILFVIQRGTHTTRLPCEAVKLRLKKIVRRIDGFFFSLCSLNFDSTPIRCSFCRSMIGISSQWLRWKCWYFTFLCFFIFLFLIFFRLRLHSTVHFHFDSASLCVRFLFGFPRAIKKKQTRGDYTYVNYTNTQSTMNQRDSWILFSDLFFVSYADLR